MEDTLAALYAAILDAPADRTVRLVYADALDETGEPSYAARAEFIRAQIELEALSESDPRRKVLADRCEELFAENWIDWWRPVCAALGLPEPHVPGRKLGARVKRYVTRDRRPVGSPYTVFAKAWSVRSDEHDFTAQFIGGFPEMICFGGAVPDSFPRWPTALPLARLRFLGYPQSQTWETIDGPHLAKL